MLNRLSRFIIGIVLLVTSPITIIPSCVLWTITDRFYLIETFEWTITNEYPN